MFPAAPLNRVPGHAICIGSKEALARPSTLEEAHITHILSIFRPTQLEEKQTCKDTAYDRRFVALDDLEEVDILSQFPTTNAYIKSAIDEGGVVLVNCAMGESRSATIVMAYLLSHDPSSCSSPAEALEFLRQCRPSISPNPGFMAQLSLYHEMGCPADLDGHPEYQRWCYHRAVESQISQGLAPAAEDLQYADERANETSTISARTYSYRCRRCRQSLAASVHLLTSHHGDEIAVATTAPSVDSAKQSNSSLCAHFFLDQPLSWMRPNLEEGRLEGRLECPNIKCKTQVGRYAWQGLRCSCSQWVVPGLALAASKVDRVIDNRNKK